jgi:hypothetical protein
MKGANSEWRVANRETGTMHTFLFAIRYSLFAV